MYVTELCAIYCHLVKCTGQEKMRLFGGYLFYRKGQNILREIKVVIELFGRGATLSRILKYDAVRAVRAVRSGAESGWDE